MEIIKNYINGLWVESVTARTFTSTNPATGEVVGLVTLSGPEDVRQAVDAAAAAFNTWRKVPAPERAEIIMNISNKLSEHKEELAQLLTTEMGKVLHEARGDVQEAIDIAAYMAGEGRRLFGFTTPSELKNKFCLTMRDPVGVIAAISAWNFPVAIPAWKIMPALIAGNTVVFKPASEAAAVGAAFVKILAAAGVPAGVVNLVIGSGSEVGNAIVDNPKVKAISFTGSTATGTGLYARAAALNKRVSLEMGGKNAIIVMNDADLDLAVDGIVWSAYGTTGQRCTACSRVIVHKDVKEELVKKLVVRIKELKIGNGLDASVDVGPVINKGQLEKIHEYVQIGVAEGAKLVAGGQITAISSLPGGSFYLPTLFDGVSRNMRIAQEEIFGPVLSVITIDSLEEAIDVNNDTAFGLSSSIYTANINAAFTAMRELTTGIVYINAGTTGAEVHLPFGGTRGTGNGHREVANAAFEFCTEWKSVYVDYSGKLQRAQIDNR
ncbi:aldehyde dehydrogenase family protein [Sporomusa termitida]|uniref:3-sulfolactaldehyde dehydrogenase n=1 Tax=Sporomusa termitida TaxID=2377 RepID=A0A517DZG7_9FIRM|nr:aldehyde dehydrogenase family protein [Sporomusa termitida]QDR82646.1 Aldehyde dehydrogenase, thermostable [Sporomusa termitida]